MLRDDLSGRDHAAGMILCVCVCVCVCVCHGRRLSSGPWDIPAAPIMRKQSSTALPTRKPRMVLGRQPIRWALPALVSSACPSDSVRIGRRSPLRFRGGCSACWWCRIPSLGFSLSSQRCIGRRRGGVRQSERESSHLAEHALSQACERPRPHAVARRSAVTPTGVYSVLPAPKWK